MSLMNDALRKRRHEQPKHPTAAALAATPTPYRRSLRWVAVSALLLTLAAALVGIHWIQAESAPSLTVNPTGGRAPEVALDPPTQAGQTFAKRPVTVNRPVPAQPVAAITDVDSNRHNAPAPVMPATDRNRLPAPVESAPNPDRSSAAEMAAVAPPPTNHSTPPIDTSAGGHGREPNRPAIAQPEPLPSRPPPHLTVQPPARQPAKETAPSAAAESHSTANDFLLKAQAYHRNGRLTEAIRFYQQALHSDPHHHEAWLNLSAAYIAQGDYHLAQPILRRLESAALSPDGVLLNLAITAIGMGTPEKALDYLDQAAATSDAPYWEIDFHRATALARMNRLTEALALYRQAEMEQPGHSALQFNLAVTCDALGDYAAALDHYRTFLQLQPPATASEAAQINQRIRTLETHLGAGRTALMGR